MFTFGLLHLKKYKALLIVVWKGLQLFFYNDAGALSKETKSNLKVGEGPASKVANVLDCDIVVSEFELHLCYHFHFCTNSFEKGLRYLSNRLNSTTPAFLQG